MEDHLPNRKNPRVFLFFWMHGKPSSDITERNNLIFTDNYMIIMLMKTKALTYWNFKKDKKNKKKKKMKKIKKTK